MRTIEAGGVCIDEVEFHDETLPHVGFTLEARATYRCPLGGGVLADVMGGGKTVTALALIAAGRQRAAEGLPKGSPHQLKATLVVAPPILLQQWDDERKKFTGDKLRSIVIRSPSALKQVTNPTDGV
jgi:SNF2 family DNA or RNA helicase